MRRYPDYGSIGSPNMDPYYLSPSEEQMLDFEEQEREENFRDAIAGAIADNRCGISVARVREILAEELGKLDRKKGGE